MTHVNATSRRSEQGFTLVELAIVMVIIGLLIGGILKGQELIANAKISGTVTQIKGLDAAMNTFFDKYNARAGLMSDATTRLPGCAAPCANVTDANYTNFAAPTGAADAKVQTFIHLSQADLISGIDTTGSSVTFGKLLPSVKAGGGMWVGTANTGAAGGFAALSTGKPYAILNGSVAATTATSGALTATAAAQIDRKMDDGRPLTGSVQALGCEGTTAGAYGENDQTLNCALAARVEN